MTFHIACGSHHDFLDRGLLLTRKLLIHADDPVKLTNASKRVFNTSISTNVYNKGSVHTEVSEIQNKGRSANLTPLS